MLNFIKCWFKKHDWIILTEVYGPDQLVKVKCKNCGKFAWKEVIFD